MNVPEYDPATGKLDYVSVQVDEVEGGKTFTRPSSADPEAPTIDTTH